MQVGGADASTAETHEHIGRAAWLGDRDVDELERTVVLAQQAAFIYARAAPASQSAPRRYTASTSLPTRPGMSSFTGYPMRV